MINKAIQKHGTKFVKTNADQVRHYFDMINAEIFDGALPKFSEIKIGAIRNIHAQVSFEDTLENPPLDLEIGVHFRTFERFLNVLSHEAIHVWQIVVKKDFKAEHDNHFFSWKEKFAEHGLTLEEKY